MAGDILTLWGSFACLRAADGGLDVKKVSKEICVQTVMLEQYVRYLRDVRDRYLLLGWW